MRVGEREHQRREKKDAPASPTGASKASPRETVKGCLLHRSRAHPQPGNVIAD